MKTLLLTICLLLSGCAQIIIEKDGTTVKVNTLFKDIDIDKLDAAGLFSITEYQGVSQEVDLWTPWGIIKSKKK